MLVADKQYYEVSKATGSFVGVLYMSELYDPDVSPEPSWGDTDTMYRVLVTPTLLSGEQVDAFPVKFRPVVSGGTVSGWEARHSGLNCTISAAPKNDGSNTPYISLKDGLPNSAFRATSSTGVALNAQAIGTLNGTGDATFRVKITDGSIVLGSVMISPDGHDDFVPVSFSFNVVAGDF